MGELTFPAAAIGVTLGVIVPALTLVAANLLRRRRQRAARWADVGDDATFALLVAPTALPVVWLLSSALHQSEPRFAGEPCLVEHAAATTCLDALLLLALLVLGFAGVGIGRAWRERPAFHARAIRSAHPMARRIRALCASRPELAGLRVRVVSEAPEPVCTIGYLRPRVYVDACFVSDADDAMLIAALLHERAHIEDRDSLRLLVARCCLAVNPAGALLQRELGHWQAAREAQCDSAAVALGGDALALAASILHAARFRCHASACAGVSALCGHDDRTLQLRIALLLDGPTRPARSFGHLALALALLWLAASPHLGGPGLLESFHFEVERLLHVAPH